MLCSLQKVISLSNQNNIITGQEVSILCMVSGLIAKVYKTIPTGQSTTCQKDLESLMVI